MRGGGGRSYIAMLLCCYVVVVAVVVFVMISCQFIIDVFLCFETMSKLMEVVVYVLWHFEA